MENALLILILSLLCIELIYIIILNYQLAHLKLAKQEIQKTLFSFNQATEQAKVAIFQMQKGAQNINDQLQQQIQRASSLQNELTKTDRKTPSQITFSSFQTKNTENLQKASFQTEAEKDLYSALQRLKEEV